MRQDLRGCCHHFRGHLICRQPVLPREGGEPLQVAQQAQHLRFPRAEREPFLRGLPPGERHRQPRCGERGGRDGRVPDRVGPTNNWGLAALYDLYGGMLATSVWLSPTA